MDRAIVGSCRVGYTRVGVYVPEWDALVERVEAVGGVTCDATRRKLVLGTEDSTTGWYSKDWEENSIEGILILRNDKRVALAAGTYVGLDGVFLTADVLEPGDEVQVGDEFYEVKTAKPKSLADSFVYRVCDVTHLPFHYK